MKKEQANVDNEAVSVYGGKVGKLEAVFFIEWAGVGNPVEGQYYYPDRGRAKMYVLKGSNPKNGVLLLDEFTRNANGVLKKSAICRLAKKLTATRIVWEGTMTNLDGRQLSMSFSRLR